MEKLGFSKYPIVFNPSAPAKFADLYVGRDDEIFSLKKVLDRDGKHAAVFGERGIGKTSLTEVVLADRDEKPIKLMCGADWTFLDFSYQLLKRLGKDPNLLSSEKTSERTIKPGFSVPVVKLEGEKKEVEKVTYSGADGTSWDSSSLIQELWDHGKKEIIVLDEYDLIEKSNLDFHKNISHFLKGCSDHPVELPFTFIVVGIAESAKDLFAGHQSSGRNIEEIFLKFVKRQGIKKFIRNAQVMLGINITDDVVDRVTNSSFGYPYFVHLICENICDSIAIEEPERREINLDFYLKGVSRAVEGKYQDMKDKYRDALKDRLTTNGKDVLKWLSLYYDQAIREIEELDNAIVGNGHLSMDSYKKGIQNLRNAELPLKLGIKYINVNDPLFLPFVRKYYWQQAIPNVPSIYQGTLFGPNNQVNKDAPR